MGTVIYFIAVVILQILLVYEGITIRSAPLTWLGITLCQVLSYTCGGL